MISEQRKIYLAEWRERNREKVRESQRKYRNANKELCNTRVLVSHGKKPEYYTQKSIEWQKENKDRYLEIKRQSYAKNSAIEIERVRRRQGRIKQGLNLMSHAETIEIQGMYDFCKIFKNFEVDHIVPLNGKIVSGLHVLSNLQVINSSVNRSKGAKFNPDDFANKE
jgi:hypothetical protein